MPARKNPLKSALKAQRLQRGLWLNLQSALTAEIAGNAGFDWCLIDAEHGLYDIAAIQAQLIALNGTGTEAVARVPCDHDWVLKQVLDLGVQSILVPMVESADQARAAVQAVRYPPHGIRGMGAAVARASGFGATPDYGPTANDQICLMVQVESQTALAALPEICAVEGVDAVFVGPADLACDMGHIAQMGHPEVQRAIDGAISVILEAGQAAGIIAFDPAAISDYARKGVTFLGVGSDAVVLTQGLRQLATG